MQNIKAVILDIDGTIAKYNSWVTLTEKLGADVKQLLKYLKELRINAISSDEANRLVTKLWVDTGNATRTNILKIYEGTEFNIDAVSIFEYLTSKYKVCLISGTTDLYVETISKKLNNVDYYWNTKMEFDSDGILKSIDYIVEQSGLKKKQFTEWAKINTVEAKDCAIVGDGDSDTMLLKELGLPILLLSQYTNDELKQSVSRHINSISEIKSYL